MASGENELEDKKVAVEEDLLDEPAEPEQESLFIILSRGVGAMSRQVKELSQVFAPRRSHGVRRKREVHVAELIKSLGEMMKAHETAQYGPLAREPEFWKLVRALARAAPVRRVEPRERAGGPRAAVNSARGGPPGQAGAAANPDTAGDDSMFQSMFGDESAQDRGDAKIDDATAGGRDARDASTDEIQPEAGAPVAKKGPDKPRRKSDT